MGAAIGIIVGVLGVLAAAYFWNNPRQPRITVELTEVGFIAPHLMGLEVGLRLGGRNLRNLYLLEVSVSNKGPGDAVDPRAETEDKLDRRPRIDLPDHFKVPEQVWLHTDLTPRADVRLSRFRTSSNGHKTQSLAVHIHHLSAGETIKHRLLATCEVKRPEGGFGLARSEVKFFPGVIENVTVRGVGLLGEPPETLKA